MKTLIVGNLGYIGCVLVKHIRNVKQESELIGYDNALFAHCLTGSNSIPERYLNLQYYGDVREMTEESLKGLDAVVYLAAVSNDPMGNRFERVTGAINHDACIRLAKMAKKCGVRAFVFASSCSIYGFTDEGKRCETDILNPLTAYARSKVSAENDLRQIGDKNFLITSLRFSTACGMSDRLRLDLVLNDFVACAVTTKKITVLSDGSPWRPLIDVKDMARAIEWALDRDYSDGGAFISVNIGKDSWNFQIKDLAEAVANAIPGTIVSINKDALPDKRSYKVDFSEFARLAPYHQPMATIEETINELKEGLESIRFKEDNFRDSNLIRLNVLVNHISRGVLNDNLEWIR